MSQLYGKVGVSPGTTTISINRGGSITLLGGYFDARPTDFEMVPRRGFLPVHRGWITGKITGKLSGAACGSCPTGLRELGADESTLAPDQQAAVAKFVLDQLAIEEKALALKEARSRRFWGSIAGLAAGTTAIVAVLNYMKTR